MEEEERGEIEERVLDLFSKSTPDQWMELGQSLADHLLDDKYLSKMTEVNLREIELLAYGRWFADRWHWPSLNEYINEKLRLRISNRRKGRTEIRDLSSPVQINQRKRWRWPFG